MLSASATMSTRYGQGRAGGVCLVQCSAVLWAWNIENESIEALILGEMACERIEEDMLRFDGGYD